MSTLVINFVDQRYRTRWAIAAAAVVCTVTAAGLLAYQLHPLVAARLTKSAQSSVASVGKAAEQPLAQQPIDRAHGLYAADGQRWASIAAFETAGVLAALEATQVPGVRVASVAIHPERAWASADLTSARLDQALNYVEELNRNDRSGAWVLRSLRETDGGFASTAERSALPAHRQR